MRRVELFFIKFFTFWVRCIKKRIDLLKKRYISEYYSFNAPSPKPLISWA
ncbi:hypothetical protein HMPREF9554_02558 [Treponema phagedenis F0421]|nr:hypothetical protein HMPREF9554_02558 [Treponema phagedenis F0421]